MTTTHKCCAWTWMTIILFIICIFVLPFILSAYKSFQSFARWTPSKKVMTVYSQCYIIISPRIRIPFLKTFSRVPMLTVIIVYPSSYIQNCFMLVMSKKKSWRMITLKKMGSIVVSSWKSKSMGKLKNQMAIFPYGFKS